MHTDPLAGSASAHPLRSFQCGLLHHFQRYSVRLFAVTDPNSPVRDPKFAVMNPNLVVRVCNLDSSRLPCSLAAKLETSVVEITILGQVVASHSIGSQHMGTLCTLHGSLLLTLTYLHACISWQPDMSLLPSSDYTIDLMVTALFNTTNPHDCQLILHPAKTKALPCEGALAPGCDYTITLAWMVNHTTKDQGPIHLSASESSPHCMDAVLAVGHPLYQRSWSCTRATYLHQAASETWQLCCWDVC